MNSNLQSEPLSFAPMYQSHVPMIGALERRNYEFFWTEGIFRDCVKSGYICQLAMLNEDVIGYGVMQIGADEAHLLNLCIDKPWQRRGYALRMLDHLINEASVCRANIVFLEVRPSNTRAVELYQQSGFNEIGLRKDYYDSKNGREDALVMARNLVHSYDDVIRL